MAKREPFKYGRKTCIFCSGTGMSKEHIWARWMLSYLPKDTPNYSKLDVIVHRTHETKTAREEDRSAYSGTIRLVCEKCNNEWMSQLQTEAKPILLHLMKGERRSMNRKEQTTLAAWITMFVMVSEFQVPDKVAIQQYERQRFKETRQPPDGWAFWLGMYDRKKWVGITVHNTIAVNSAEDDVNASNPDGGIKPNTHSTTVVIGKLYVHVMGSIFPEFARKQRLDRVGLPVTRLWPRGIKPFKWAADNLADNEASGIATALIDFYRRKLPRTEVL